MGEITKTNSYTEFFYYTFRNILIFCFPLTIISAIILSSLHISADASNNGSGSSTDTLSFNISSSCTLSSVVDSSHTAELINGTYTNSIGQTTITTLCNDGNGYSVYAVGYSNNEEGNNKLVNTDSPNFNIISGTATSGTTSNWAMSLNNLVDDPSLTPPVITSDYDSIYGIVPDKWTKVASLPARATDMIKGSSFTTTYAVYTSSSQYAGTYNGQVKYMLVHPSYKPAVYFMQDVADWKDQLGMEESVLAVDVRDGKKYWVTKLKDGNIWMTQNLDLDLDPAKPLTSNDTDLTDHSLAGAYADDYNYNASTGVTTWTPERKTIDFQNTTVTGWKNDNNNPYSASKTDSAETGRTSLGNYYNWTAAIASNNSSSLTQDTISDITKNPKNSICPKGWRLPTISNQSETVAGSTNEFARLNFLYNNGLTNTDAGLVAPPLWFILGSNHRDVSIGFDGNYWSSTIYNSSYSYYINFRLGGVNPEAYTSSLGRSFGFSVRCVVR